MTEEELEQQIEERQHAEGVCRNFAETGEMHDLASQHLRQALTLVLADYRECREDILELLKDAAPEILKFDYLYGRTADRGIAVGQPERSQVPTFVVPRMAYPTPRHDIYT